MNKAVFLDRDGVLNVDKNYLYKVEELELVKGAKKAIDLLKDYKIIVITNQSGIGRGYYTEEDYLKLREHISKLVRIDDEYYCPHAPEVKCDCRKPSPLLIEKAIKKHDIDREKSYFIGDKTSDIMAGKNAGLKTILVLTGKAGNDKRHEIKPDYVCKDLLDAANSIIQNDS